MQVYPQVVSGTPMVVLSPKMKSVAWDAGQMLFAGEPHLKKKSALLHRRVNRAGISYAQYPSKGSVQSEQDGWVCVQISPSVKNAKPLSVWPRSSRLLAV